jgi:[protein-PII] uridylyltransferase
MTPWKAYLLAELYEKTFSVLEKGDFALEKRSEKVRRRKKKIAGLLTEDFSERRIKEELKQLPTRYVLSHSALEISEHFRVIFNRGEGPLAMQVFQEPETGCSRLVVSTLDQPGLFSSIAGVLTANGINILSAQIYTLKNGVALDILRVNSNRGKIVDNEDKWRRVGKTLGGVVEGRVQVHDLVRQRKRGLPYPAAQRPRFSARVEIDNEISEHYTVIDLFADDRIGLLYDITRTLSKLNLAIGVSKISTKVDQVADTFYVQDVFGDKITQADKLDELRRKLFHVLDGAVGKN